MGEHADGRGRILPPSRSDQAQVAEAPDSRTHDESPAVGVSPSTGPDDLQLKLLEACDRAASDNYIPGSVARLLRLAEEIADEVWPVVVDAYGRGRDDEANGLPTPAGPFTTKPSRDMRDSLAE